MKMMNYNIEREHDWCLICLVNALDKAGRLDILRDAFRIEEDLGCLKWSGRRRKFDVELQFANLFVAIETKVHSDEGGRWPESELWQTERIAKERKEVKGLCFFITYGTSEFYTKPYKTGPASPEFQHVPLERMIYLVESSIAALPQIGENPGLAEWLRLMRLEKEKREKAQELLHSFAEFRTRYLEVHGENDFPRGRIAFSAPELAFPVFSKLVEHWNESEYVDEFGHLSVYPIPRGFSPVVDSILNFWEMWEEKEPVLAPDIVESKRHLYLEINEDFNLNLKSGIELGKKQKEKIWKRLQGAEWPSGVTACSRDYQQQVWVLYEVDFGLLANVNCLWLCCIKIMRTAIPYRSSRLCPEFDLYRIGPSQGSHPIEDSTVGSGFYLPARRTALQAGLLTFQGMRQQLETCLPACALRAGKRATHRQAEDSLITRHSCFSN